MAGGVPDFFHRHHIVVTPAATTPAVPLVTSLEAGPVVLDQLTVRFPATTDYHVGFRVMWSGVQLLPANDEVSWIVGDNESLPFAVGLEVDRHLELWTYNDDLSDHTVYVHVREYHTGRRGGPRLAAIIPAADIKRAADL